MISLFEFYQYKTLIKKNKKIISIMFYPKSFLVYNRSTFLTCFKFYLLILKISKKILDKSFKLYLYNKTLALFIILILS